MLTLYELMERYDEATECGRRALAITEQEFGPDDVNVAGILRRIGQLEMNQRKFKQARETLNRALTIATAKFGPDHPNTGYELRSPIDLTIPQREHLRSWLRRLSGGQARGG